jgi:hypothetical protein
MSTPTTPSRFAAKSLIPSTIDAQPSTTERLPDTTSPTDRASSVQDKKADRDWEGRTEEFLAAEPEPAAAAAAAGILPDLSINFRHSGWIHNRHKVDAALLACPDISPRRLTAFRQCGADAFVEEGDATQCDAARMNPLTHAIKAANPKYRCRSTKCHDRFCVPCSNERSARVRASLMAHMQGRANLSLITLTLKASDATLTDVMDRLQKCFRAVRQKTLWKKAVKGGVSIIETKIGGGSGQWHCHYHVIAEAGFIDQRKLSNLWFEVTGDSQIVDIRRVGAITGAVSYITKYVTKAADKSIVESPKHLQESIIAFTGRRMISTFGSWRGLELMERPENENSTDIPQSAWRTIGSLSEILQRAAAGDPAAAKIIKALTPARFRPSG